MPDTFTTDGVGLILMGVGGDNNTWGTNLNNSALQIIADALSNTLSATVTGGTLDLSGNPPPAATSQAHHSVLAFGGTLTANQIVVVPNLAKWWWVANSTSGAFTLTLQLPGAVSPIVIPAGGAWLVRCNGAGGLALTALGLNRLIPTDGSAAVPSFSFQSEQNSGWYRAGTQDVRLAVNGSDVLQVTGAGAASPSVVNVVTPESFEIAGSPAGFFTTGDVKLTFKTSADPGWVLMNDNTIGDASSNAAIANANTGALWQLLYNNISDADAPILTSGGVATTRGAQGSAATAYANHCQLTLPLALGRALAVAGGGAGLTHRNLGDAVGEETHTLSSGELAPHTHAQQGTFTTGNESQFHTHSVPSGASSAGTVQGGGSQPQFAGTQTTGNESVTHTHNVTISGNTGSTGGGAGHNNMQPTTFLNVMIKL